jgi:hypothetical protein
MSYKENVSGLPEDHPDYNALTLRTLAKVGGGLLLGTIIAWNAVSGEAAPQRPERPVYEAPHNPVIDGQSPPLHQPSLPPSPEDLGWVRAQP